MKNVNMVNSKIKNIFISSWQLYIDNALYVMNIFLLISIISNIILHFNSGFLPNFNSIQESLTTNQDIPMYHLIFYVASQLFITGLQLGMLKAYLLLNQTQKRNSIRKREDLDYIV